MPAEDASAALLVSTYRTDITSAVESYLQAKKQLPSGLADLEAAGFLWFSHSLRAEADAKGISIHWHPGLCEIRQNGALATAVDLLELQRREIEHPKTSMDTRYIRQQVAKAKLNEMRGKSQGALPVSANEFILRSNDVPERRLVSLWKQVNSRLVSFLILNGRLPTTGDELFNTFNGLPSGLHAVPVGDDLYLKVDLDHRNGIIRLERKPSIDLVDVNYVKTNFVRETQTAKQELIDESAIPKDAKFEPLLTLAFQAE